MREKTPLRVLLSQGEIVRNKLKSDEDGHTVASNNKWPWSWGLNTKIEIDKSHLNNKSRGPAVIVDVVRGNGAGENVGRACIAIASLGNEEERDDWFPVNNRKKEQIGWIHMNLHLTTSKKGDVAKPVVSDADVATKISSKVAAEDKPELSTKAVTKDTILDGKFTQLKLLGSGNFGKCYRALSNVDDQLYAVKMIPAKTDKELTAIKAEAKVLWSMQHRNITRYFSAFRHESLFCVVMDFCSGGNLNDVVIKARQGKLQPPLTVQRVKMWTSQIAEALAYLQEMGLLHRDLKGDNVFLQDGVCKLADFGLATKAALVRGQAGAFAYESPEQAGNHRYGAPNDWWALGCIVTELSTLKFVSERTKQQVFSFDAQAVAASVRETAAVDNTLGQVCSGLLDANQNTRMQPKQVIAALATSMSATANQGFVLFTESMGGYATSAPPAVGHPTHHVFY